MRPVRKIRVDRLAHVRWESVHFTTDTSDEIQRAIAEWPVIQHLKDWSALTVRIVDASTPGALDEKAAKALQFPSYYGHNLDALYDCLTDLDDWMDFQALVLIVENASHLWREAPLEAGTFQGIWLAAAEQWGKEEKPFHLVFCV
jgi:Barstar (barnase inhibitor)